MNSTPKRVKVRVALTLEIDPEVWALEYGEQENLREDVRGYVLEMIYGASASESGAIADVKLA